MEEIETEKDFKKEETELKRQLEREKRILKLEKRLEKTKNLQKELTNEFGERLITLTTTAFGVVAALFWQTAINDTIKAFIPIKGLWAYEIIVAVFVTLIATIAIFTISRFIKQKK